jgi:hypothetical protein
MMTSYCRLQKGKRERSVDEAIQHQLLSKNMYTILGIDLAKHGQHAPQEIVIRIKDGLKEEIISLDSQQWDWNQTHFTGATRNIVQSHV